VIVQFPPLPKDEALMVVQGLEQLPIVRALGVYSKLRSVYEAQTGTQPVETAPPPVEAGPGGGPGSIRLGE